MVILGWWEALDGRGVLLVTPLIDIATAHILGGNTTRPYRGTSLIKKSPTPRTTVGLL